VQPDSKRLDNVNHSDTILESFGHVYIVKMTIKAQGHQKPYGSIENTGLPVNV